MARRAKVKSLMVVCDSFLEILHLSQLLKAGQNSSSEVVEGQRSIGMTEGIAVNGFDGAVRGEVLHPSEEGYEGVRRNFNAHD